MEPTIVNILKVEPVTHNVRRFTLERPEGLTFVPGQAADISINTLTQEETKSFDHRLIDAAYLKEKLPTFSSYFYLCGPDPMVLALQKTLISLGAESSKVIVEQF